MRGARASHFLAGAGEAGLSIGELPSHSILMAHLASHLAGKQMAPCFGPLKLALAIGLGTQILRGRTTTLAMTGR